MVRSKSFKLLVSFLISGGLIFWIYKSTNWQDVAMSFKLVKDRWFYLIPAVLVFLLHYVIRALRWEYLLGVHTSFLARFNAIQFGNFTTYMLPARAGEFLRPLYLCKKTNLAYPSTFVSIVTERFFDLIMALICFAVMLSLIDIPQDSWVLKGVPVLGALAVCIFVFIFLAIFYEDVLLKVFHFFKDYCPKNLYEKLENIVNEVIEGVKPLKNPKNLLITTLYSALVWISTVGFYYAFLFLFFDEPSLKLSLAIVVCIAFAVAAPSVPGFVGVFQAACIAAFTLCGESRETAVTYSIVSHLSHYLVFVIYGSILLAKNGVGLLDRKKISA